MGILEQCLAYSELCVRKDEMFSLFVSCFGVCFFFLVFFNHLVKYDEKN